MADKNNRKQLLIPIAVVIAILALLITISTAYSSLNAQVQVNTERISRVEKDIGRIFQILDRIEKKIDGLTKELGAVKTDVAEIRAVLRERR